LPLSACQYSRVTGCLQSTRNRCCPGSAPLSQGWERGRG